jgi:hypothetical protein
MAKVEENRECLICGNLIPPEDESIPVNSKLFFKVPGDKRIVHVSCVREVILAYKSYKNKKIVGKSKKK